MKSHWSEKMRDKAANQTTLSRARIKSLANFAMGFIFISLLINAATLYFYRQINDPLYKVNRTLALYPPAASPTPCIVSSTSTASREP
jgi:hypothetical protein